MRKYINKYTWLSILLLYLSNPMLAMSAPGALADIPLFITTSAPPSVMFLVDDSGSMEAELSTGERPSTNQDTFAGGLFGVYGAEAARLAVYTYVMPTTENRDIITANGLTTAETRDALVAPTLSVALASTASSLPAMQGIWRVRNSSFNTLYYDPTRNYQPWPGQNNSNETFVNARPTCAPIDPYAFDFSNNTGTCNDQANFSGLNDRLEALDLTQTRNVTFYTPCTAADVSASRCIISTNNGNLHGVVANTASFYPSRYWIWVDSNSNNIVDGSDDHKLIEIKAGTPVCPSGTNATVAEQYSNGCMLRSYSDEIDNFANWYTYHRRREYVAKSAIGEVVKNISGMQMGFASINHTNQGGEREAELALVNGAVSTTEKANLLDAVYSVRSAGGTPLRRALDEIGRYYACTNTDSNDDPFGTACAVNASGPRRGNVEFEAPGACTPNFTILIADGDWNGSNVSGSDKRTADDSQSTQTFRDDLAGINRSFSFDGAPYLDATSNTLADVAMYYYERDLHDGSNGSVALRNLVPKICGVDENPGQHMVTYTVNFGVTGSMDPDTVPAHPRLGYADNCPVDTRTSFNWTVANSSNGNAVGRIDDMVHAAFNGRGQFLSAQNPEQLTNGLLSTLNNITNRRAAAAAVTFNATSLDSGAVVFQATFRSGEWSGEVLSLPIDSAGVLSSTPTWQAGDLLSVSRNISNGTITAATISDFNNRTLITFDRTTYTGKRLEWSQLNTLQQQDLNTAENNVIAANNSSGRSDGEIRLDYLSGDHSCEFDYPNRNAAACNNLAFRSRISSLVGQVETRTRLGDIINSDLVFVGRPEQRYPDSGAGSPFGDTGDSHSDFRQGTVSNAFTSSRDATDRTPMLYVGANDGFLHAFNASSGVEEWAFMPHSVFGAGTNKGVHDLTETSYSHKYYVDMPLVVSDAYTVIPGDATKKWRTIMVGGLRGGGQGIFAIDVTDPDDILTKTPGSSIRRDTAASKVLWEFTGADNPDFGFTFSKPTIVPLAIQNNPTASGTNHNRIDWFVVIGNGYAASSPIDGDAKLFVLRLSGPGGDNVWDLNTDYFIIDTNRGTTSNQNGLSTPALIDNNFDGIADRAYAGDLFGNMWAFDLNGPFRSPGNTAGRLAFGAPNASAPLFTAPGGSSQPITAQPTVIRHPTEPTVTEPNVLVYFGTGSFISDTDIAVEPPPQQTFFAIWDKGININPFDGLPFDLSDLQQQVIATQVSFTDVNGDVDEIRITSNNPVDYSTQYGWYMQLITPAPILIGSTNGERVIAQPRIRGQTVFFNTIIPSPSPCDQGGGGFLMALDAVSGARRNSVPFDVNNNGVIDSADLYNLAGTDTIVSGKGCDPHNTGISCDHPGLPGESSFISEEQCTPRSDGSLECRKIEPGSTQYTGRFSWRELEFNDQ